MARPLFVAWALLIASNANAEVFSISLRDAEKLALTSSKRLKSFVTEEQAAFEQTQAQFSSLFPRLSIQGNYTYFGTIPQVSFVPGMPSVGFGNHNTYTFGPTLTYTLWDTYSAKKLYHSAENLTQSRAEDRRNAELQILYSLRSAYVQVQLGTEELRLIHESLNLSRAQERDVRTRLQAGAAARIDLVTAQRSVLNYEIQFKQKQTQLSATLKDLLTLLGKPLEGDLSHPGPEGIPGVSIDLRLDPLTRTLDDETQTQAKSPNDEQPQLRSYSLQAESLRLNAESQSSRQLPVIQLTGSLTYNLPNIPNPPQFWQQALGVSLSMPLFIGDPTSHLSAQQRYLALSAEHRGAQLKQDLERDYAKMSAQVESLREQRVLATKDVAQSKEAANLYYQSYKAGRMNFIDVQNANLQALTAKVNAARLDAQILNQSFLLKSISGEEVRHE